MQIHTSPRDALSASLVSFCLASAATLPGQTLLADVDPTPPDPCASSSPASFSELDGLELFHAEDPTHGRELRSSDGTAAGTRPVLDIVTGSVSSRPSALVGLNGRVVFAAATASGERRWFTTDGTPAGTVELGGVRSDAADEAMARARYGNRPVFQGATSTTGAELQSTDGTPAGTLLVADVRPGADSSSPQGFVEWNGRGWFRASDPTHGDELWSTDGTPAGTIRLADIEPGSGAGLVNALPVAAIGSAWFAGTSSAVGTEPWRSDGTPTGTALLADLAAETFGSNPGPALTSGPDSFLLVEHSTTGTEPLRTDGTPAGTALRGDFTPGATGASSMGHVADGDTAWWSTGTTLLTSDLLGNNTAQPGNNGPYGKELVRLGGQTYFWRGAFDAAVWTTDGTPAGTRPIYSAGGGFFIISPAKLTVSGQQLWSLAGVRRQANVGVYVSDGTTAGTRFHLRINRNVNGSVEGDLKA